jgi:hypothetical protein
MRQMIKSFLCMVFLAYGLQASWGFALLGPIPANATAPDGWQTAVIGYNLAYTAFVDISGNPVFLGDIGGPKNYAEGYRRNAPVLYYAYDENFSGFFGLDGETAVDQAFNIMNSAFTNNPTGTTQGLDGYSSSLSEFPFNSQHFNYTAQSLFLTDLKSTTLHLLVEQLGLAQPERFTWTLAERASVGPACPADEIYDVVQRNFDAMSTSPNQILYSSYVNNILYTYWILEACAPPDPLAVTEPFAVDPEAQQYTSVAADTYSTALGIQGGVLVQAGGGLQIGGFYTGLTRDDVEGLRYLLRTNNINLELPATGSQIVTTNISSTILINDLDLGLLSASALTNSPTALQALFPNLLILSVVTNYTVVCTPNVVSYLTNFIGAPAGSAPVFVVVTNGSNCAYQPVYTYTFANVITNTFFTNSYVQTVTTTLGSPPIGAPVGSPLVTNSTSTSTTLSNVTSGSYFIIPAGDCGLIIVPGSGITNSVTMTTNVITTFTNSAGFVYSQSIVTIFNNLQFLAHPIICGTATPVAGRYQGIEKVQFVRVPDLQVDPLTGNFLQPITNTYSMVIFNPTNSQYSIQTFQRVVTRPDILITAADDIAANTFVGTVVRNINYNQANILPGLAGPGVINSPTTFSFNKVGLTFQNGPVVDTTQAFLSELTDIPSVAWASFDASTNDPEVYPNGQSIQNLENQLAIQISPTSLANGTNNSVYVPVTFTATGGGFAPPFTWSATGLPTGLTVSSGGTLSGTPTQSGTFDFTLQLTDSFAHSVQWTYSITIQ